MKKFILPILVILACIIMLYLNSKNIDTTTYLNLNEQLIDKVIESNSELTKDMQFIAIDAYSFSLVNDKETALLISYLSKYKVNVIIGRENMLEEDEFVSNGVYKGIFISADNVVKESNNVSIEVKLSKSKEKYKTSKFEAKYYLNNWHINNIINK